MATNIKNKSNEDQIKCKTEQNIKYIKELNCKLCDYDDVIAQRDEIKNNMSTALSKLESMKTKQTDTINELICKYDTLSTNYNADREELTHLIEENDCLRNKIEQLHDELDEQERLLEESENLYSAMLEESQKLQNKYEETMEMANECQYKYRLAETELKVKEEDLICLQNALEEKTKYNTQLENHLNDEYVQNESLQSLINELKIKYDSTITHLKAKITEQQSKLNEILPKLAMTKRQLKDKQEEIETQNYQMSALKKGGQELRQLYFNEKNKAEKMVDELKTEMKSKALELESIGTELCNAQIKNAKLKCQLKDEEDAIKCLETTIKQLQQEVRTAKEATELTTNIIKTEREQHDKEVEIFEKKFESKDHEKDELEQSIAKQNEQIKKLKKQLFDLKFKPSELRVPDTVELCGEQNNNI